MNNSVKQIRIPDVEILSAKRLNIIISIFSITFTISFWFGFLYGRGRPFEIPYNARDLFTDFFSALVVAKDPYSLVGFGRGYFPFIYLFLWPFCLFSTAVALLLGLMFFIVFFYISSYLFLDNTFNRLASSIALCSFSYVFIFILDRANVEMFVYIFIAMFMLIYFKPNKRIPLDILSALFLSFAINSKLYPGVFTILMLRDKRFRCLGLTMLFSVIIFFSSFAAVNGTFNGLFANLNWFNDNYGMPVFKMVSPEHTHSLFDFFKSLLLLVKKNVDDTSAIILKFKIPYTILVFIFFSFIATYVVLYEKSKWRAVFLLTTAMVLFPYASHDYTLIHMFIPMFMYIKSKEDNGSLDYIYSILLAIVFSQLSWLNIIKNFNWSIGILIRPSVILTIMFIIFIQGLKNANLKDFKQRFIHYAKGTPN